MHRYSSYGAAAALVVALVVGSTAGVGWAKGTQKPKPTVSSSLSSTSIPYGDTVNDTATVVGKAAKGSPTGTVTFSVCGPTSSATPCTSPNGGSATVTLSTEARHRSTATVTVDPGATGWFCLLDRYSGDAKYKAASDNNTGTECFDVTNGGTGHDTPTIKSSLSSSSIPYGDSAVDTAVLTGNSTAGSPTGSVTFDVCGPTSSATPCAAADAVATATVELESESGDRSTTAVTVNPGSPGWYCFFDQYNGDANYKVVTDNDTATECLDVTGSGTGSATPTLKSSLSSQSIPYQDTDVDTATVTGNSTAGSPTGSVTFDVCGPTSSATPCTAANVVAGATAGLSPESGDRSVTDVTISPGSPGWYCLLDQYNGDENYKVVTDNDTATECLDATNASSSAGVSGGATTVTAGAGRGRSASSTTLTP
jgi:hypothetical protein